MDKEGYDLKTITNMLDDTKKRIISLHTATMLEDKIASSIATYVEENPHELPVDHTGLLNLEASELKQHEADIRIPRLRE